MKRLYSAVKSHGELCRRFIAFEAEELKRRHEVTNLKQQLESLQKARAVVAEEGEQDPELMRLQRALTHAENKLEELQRNQQEQRELRLVGISWSQLMRSEHSRARAD